MAAPADDLPWPELGNVSRGATRGNQGQKGVLGPPDREGRCVLQLRVQPGVLAVRLNRQASDWYRILDNEVNRALKLTKTFWRKARRRQDYDPRADQDHMELHEWLQQLKDKTMSHLELLMQKGDILGPPYTMPDDVELTFLRKFVEREAAGIAHNPRLRNGGAPPGGEHGAGPSGYPSMRGEPTSAGSLSPEPSERVYMDSKGHTGLDHLSEPRNSGSPSLRNAESLSHEAAASKQALQSCRAAFARAQKDTQEAFIRYQACLSAENQAGNAVAAAEKRRDNCMGALLSLNQTVDSMSRHSSVSGDEPSPRYDDFRGPDNMSMRAIPNTKPMAWSDVYGEPQTHLDDPHKPRKRTWEHSQQQLQGGYHSDADYPPPRATEVYDSGAYGCQDMAGLPPPRKRVHHMMPNFDVLGSAAMQPNGMTLPS